VKGRLFWTFKEMGEFEFLLCWAADMFEPSVTELWLVLTDIERENKERSKVVMYDVWKKRGDVMRVGENECDVRRMFLF
jgi:hypothetical protein